MQRQENRIEPIMEESAKLEAVTISEPAPTAGLPSMFHHKISIFSFSNVYYISCDKSVATTRAIALIIRDKL